jgi:ABC-type sugar transport system permease subunit
MASATSISETQTAVAQARPRRKRGWGDTLAPYLFIGPFLLSFFVLFVGPAIYSFALSFYRFKGYGAATFLGLDNYKALLTYHVFWTALRNTIFYWLAHVFILMAAAFLLAVLVRSTLISHKNFYKPLIFLPNIVATVAVGLLFQSLFGTEYGVINNLLGIKIAWLQDYAIARWVVVFLLLWHGIGWWFVIFLAGLTTINPEVEEAAVVDGASGWQRMRHVTLPLMRNTFIFAFVIDAIGSFRIFNQPNVLVARGGSLANPDMAPILNLLVTDLRSARFGSSAAVGWLLFVLVLVVSYFQFRIMRGTGEEGE